MKKQKKVTKLQKANAKSRIWIWLALISMTIYIVWRIVFTIPSMEKYGVISFVCGILLVVAETISALEALEHYVSMNNMVVPKKPKISNEQYPDVDVLIATHNEDVELLYKTINGCKHMRYPDKRKVHIYLCDDNNRAEVAKLAQEMEIGYFGLEDNKDAKAGNLNHALSLTHSPYVATFDADMIPTSDFLMETIPYMFLPVMKEDEHGIWVKRREEEIDEDFKMGFIQTPQSFYNPDLFQFNFFSESRIPNEQDYFFKEINVGRNRDNAPIYAGSNTLISRAALEEVGGIATNTITEDFETGIKIQSKGYTCYAVDEVLAHGLAPTDFNNLIKQRERWGRGCIASFRHVNVLFNKGLPIRGKLSYLASFLYWFTFLRRFVYILSPILFIVFHIPVVICDWWGLLFIWLPAYLLYNHALKVSSGKIRTQRWSNIVDTVIFPYLILPILAEFFFIKKTKFHVTNKTRSTESDSDLLLGVPHFFLLIADVFALFIAIKDMVLYRNLAGIILIYWLMINGLNLLMAIIFVLGRRNHRVNDRFAVALPVSLQVKGLQFDGCTIDLSDNGMAIQLKEPIQVHEQELVELKIKDDRYEAKLQCRIVHVSELANHAWKYGLKIVEMEPEQKANYYQIVFDRHHTLADTMAVSVGPIDDLFVNVSARVKPKKESLRRYPRIIVNEMVESTSGEMVQLKDINFRYVRLSASQGTLPENITLKVDDLYLECRKSEIRTGLYEIINYEELMNQEAYQRMIASWYHKSHPVMKQV